MLPTDAPPEAGLIEIQVPAAPVSFQSTAARKAGMTAAVRALVSPCRYLLSGDVKITIQWRISERARYESDASADVDNIVKPILDALCGPDGIMVDDCQVQELTCYWSGGYLHPEEQDLVLELKFHPDEYVSKAGLNFLRIENGLYFPIHDDLPGPVVLRYSEQLIDRFGFARKMADQGLGSEAAHGTLPIQRVFHRSKIGAFRTTTIEELRQRLS